MSEYDYIQGKNRVESILDNHMIIEEKEKLPVDGSFTFENGYRTWLTSIFIDIRNSSKLFTSKNQEKTAKVIRAFISELIEILRDDDGFMLEIGIRGDCVYAIYNTPFQKDILNCANKTFDANTFINMFNKMLEQRGIAPIRAGIGMSTGYDLVIKTGRKGVGINEKVWIGTAVTEASNLSSLGDKNDYRRLMYSWRSYINFIDGLKAQNSNQNVENWFTSINNPIPNIGIVYNAGIIQSTFNEWIKSNV
ncbi:adenylate/guanylate cyclase domain-containing protein [Haemophilus haemolyticus]|uniref:Putative adenylyl cyclase class-3/4/guanylyl cyclase n=1 Tax=Haemophilus haemolyticus M19501 TaxID=1028803 RepID=F9GQY4_HAEHA|nr:adenylate/guanylate cyclase domain-containing protein [Haemophilus haemolyticus]EGT74483.1 putative adenylyl cyclase class-3/4/guanylyl cyclase [Haemophilus haemolyticus M19501]